MLKLFGSRTNISNIINITKKLAKHNIKQKKIQREQQASFETNRLEDGERNDDFLFPFEVPETTDTMAMEDYFSEALQDSQSELGIFPLSSDSLGRD
jgi:hypothetical protein